MNYEDLSTPTIVAKWFKTTPHNVRKTYVHKRPEVYKVQCVASFMMESGLTPVEIELIVELAKGVRKVYGKKNRRTKKRVP